MLWAITHARFVGIPRLPLKKRAMINQETIRRRQLAKQGLRSYREALTNSGWVITRVLLNGDVEMHNEYTGQMMMPL